MIKLNTDERILTDIYRSVARKIESGKATRESICNEFAKLLPRGRSIAIRILKQLDKARRRPGLNQHLFEKAQDKGETYLEYLERTGRSNDVMIPDE